MYRQTNHGITITMKFAGLIYGAAIGDAVGLATCCMQQDEINFHYKTDMISFSDIVADQLRVRWRQGDWTSNFDTLVNCDFPSQVPKTNSSLDSNFLTKEQTLLRC